MRERHPQLEKNVVQGHQKAEKLPAEAIMKAEG